MRNLKESFKTQRMLSQRGKQLGKMVIPLSIFLLLISPIPNSLLALLGHRSVEIDHVRRTIVSYKDFYADALGHAYE